MDSNVRRLPIEHGRELRISLSEYKWQKRLDIRIWYKGRPTPSGISIRDGETLRWLIWNLVELGQIAEQEEFWKSAEEKLREMIGGKAE